MQLINTAPLSEWHVYVNPSCLQSSTLTGADESGTWRTLPKTRDNGVRASCWSEADRQGGRPSRPTAGYRSTSSAVKSRHPKPGRPHPGLFLPLRPLSTLAVLLTEATASCPRASSLSWTESERWTHCCLQSGVRDADGSSGGRTRVRKLGSEALKEVGAGSVCCLTYVCFSKVAEESRENRTIFRVPPGLPQRASPPNILLMTY